jgi:lipopolysaccharide export LptBFGC system permease protein LptF
MVFTLQRYIFRELFRIFVMASVGLTLILSLGMVLKPAQEYGVGPRQVLHLLIYFMPVTLTFVLPMSALFASALAYGRFASDNELNACRASGIGLWTFVYPGLALALLVATANLLLSFHVMPYFVSLAERSLNADVKQVLFRNIQRRGFYEPPSFTNSKSKFRIYADLADAERNTLYGIIAVQSAKEGITGMYTADRAMVSFDSHENINEVQLSIHNARILVGGGEWSGQPGEQLLVRKSLGSLLRDDIKFKKIDEMKQIREDPMLFEPIAGRVLEVYRQLVTELVANDISRTLRSSAGRAYYELRGPTQVVRFSANGCELRNEQNEQVICLVGPVVAEEYDIESGKSQKRLQCDKEAFLHVGQDTPNPRLGLTLPGARNQVSGSPETTLEMSHIINDLELPDAIRRKLGQGSLLQIARNTRQILGGVPPSSTLDKDQKALENDIAGIFVDIKAEMNSRLVFGIGCIPMILIGIGLGIINRGGHLLSAFGASCAPAAVLIIGIVSGRQVSGNAGAQVFSGIAIMWGGLTLLVFVTAFIYRRLMRT